MAVNGIDSGYNSVNSLRGFGGLASGLDRDTLIEQMTYGTQAKIAGEKQKKQIIMWKQEAIRSVADKMYDISNKYFSYASSDNLISSSAFSMTDIKTTGEYADCISASGRISHDTNMQVMGVSQLATNAQKITGDVSNKKITTDEINLGEIDVNQLDGERLKFKIGEKNFNVKLEFTDEQRKALEKAKNSTEEGNEKVEKLVADYINKALEDVKINNSDRKLSDEIKFDGAEGNKISIKGVGNAGNTVVFEGGSDKVMKALGFQDMKEEELKISDNETVTGKNAVAVWEKENGLEKISGKSFEMSWNGKKHKIELAKYGPETTMLDVQQDIQNKIDKEFGEGRIKVDLTSENNQKSGKLSFSTIRPSSEGVDQTSIIRITGGDKELIGRNGVFGVDMGAANRINLNASLKDSGLSNIGELGAPNENGEYSLNINGTEIKGITEETTVREIMKKVNESDAGVTMNYLETSDKFVFTSDIGGAAGKVDIVAGNLSKVLGIYNSQNVDTGKTIAGQDAKMFVKFEGAEAPIEVISDSNTFVLDGISIKAEKTFNVGENGVIDNSNGVGFEATADTEAIAENVKNMIADYNDILSSASKMVNTKPNRDYKPLTDQQKEEMTEKQIEKWEEKAKNGLLFGDTDLRGVINSMRFIISPAVRKEYKEIGITVSDKYSDNGKLVFDEVKFKEAMKNDPSKVRNLFTGKESVGETKEDGLAVNISKVMDKFGKTTGSVKGVLVERAGSEHSPVSMLKNSMLDQIKGIDKRINGLNTRLKSEQDRYIKQFTSLETLIDRMNQQSAYFAQMFGNQMM